MKVKKVRRVWTDNEENELMDLWEEKLSDLRKMKRNNNVIADMSKVLARKGIIANSIQVNSKIQTLTAKYISEKKLMGQSGGSPSTFKHFKRLHKIIEVLPCNNLVPCQESFNFNNQCEAIESSSQAISIKDMSSETKLTQISPPITSAASTISASSTTTGAEVTLSSISSTQLVSSKSSSASQSVPSSLFVSLTDGKRPKTKQDYKELAQLEEEIKEAKRIVKEFEEIDKKILEILENMASRQ